MVRRIRFIQYTARAIFGGVPLILGVLAAWSFCYFYGLDEDWIVGTVVGLTLGVVVNILFLRQVLLNLFKIPVVLWMAVYLFYSIGIFGIFMGVPVFNLFLALPAGLLYGTRLSYHNVTPDEVKTSARHAALFTSSVLLLICLTSAAIALADPYTAGNLEGMLRLPFKVTEPMIIGLILAGGTALLTVNWWLTRTITIRTVAWLTPRATPDKPTDPLYE